MDLSAGNRDEPVFADSVQAGRQLAGALRARLPDLPPEDLVVVALAPGGVPVAAEVARTLGAPLDLVVVSKLGLPFRPDIGMGALSEDGAEYVDREIVREAGISAEEVSEVRERTAAEVRRRARRYRGGGPPGSLRDRAAVVVDDGAATGASATAACRAVRSRGAARVVVALPVAPRETLHLLAEEADDVIAVTVPRDLRNIEEWYRHPEPVDEERIERLLREGDRPRPSAGGPAAPPDAAPPGPPPEWAVAKVEDLLLEFEMDGVVLPADLTVPVHATGLIVAAAAGSRHRYGSTERELASRFHHRGFATLLLGLLTPHEEAWTANVADVDLLTARLDAAVRRLGEDHPWMGLMVGRQAAAAAMRVAATGDAPLGAIVVWNGRPDRAGACLPRVRVPTLLMVGEDEERSMKGCRAALKDLGCEKDLVVLPDGGRLDRPDVMRAVGDHAEAWYLRHGARRVVRLPGAPAASRA